MSSLENQLKKSNDQIINYKKMFRNLMLKWKGNPKLKKYRDWSQEMYDKVNSRDDFTDERILIDIDLHTNTNNKDEDFGGEENFNAVATILRNLWKWLKEKKEIQKKIKELKDKQSSLPKKCGQPRVGHGSEGLPCQCNLGKDNSCRYHGSASAIV
jgi:hypothetical protein